MPLFEIAILQKPTKKQAEDGEEEKLVFGPAFTVARDQQSAAIKAIMEKTPAGLDMARAEVLVRPFA